MPSDYWSQWLAFSKDHPQVEVYLLTPNVKLLCQSQTHFRKAVLFIWNGREWVRISSRSTTKENRTMENLLRDYAYLPDPSYTPPKLSEYVALSRSIQQ